MSYWVEVHCATTFEERRKLVLNERGESPCRTDRGLIPGALASNFGKARKLAEQYARNVKYKRAGGIG